MNSFFVIHAKPVSYNLHAIVYFCWSSSCSLRKKNQIIISCEYTHAHCISLSTIKFQEIHFSVLEELRWQTISEIPGTGTFFLSSKGVLLLEKNWIKMSCEYAYLQSMTFKITKFHEILLSGFRGVALTKNNNKKPRLTYWLTNS